MNSDESRKHWRKAVEAAERHLRELLAAKGHVFQDINSNIVVKKVQDNLEVEITIHIWPHYQRWRNEADGIAIRINKLDRSQTYWKKTDDYTKIDWDKIVEIVETDLAYRLRVAVRRHNENQTQESLARQAQLEVPLPITKHQWRGTIPSLEGFERTLKPDGTYELELRGIGFSREEAIAIRDIVLAKLARTNPNEKIQETAPASAA